MIRTPALMLAALLALCPATTTAANAAAPARCEAAVTRDFDFTGPHAGDALDVSARGPDCMRSVVTVTIRKSDGMPVMTFAMPLIWLHDTIDTTQPLTEENLGALLKAYVADAQLDIAGSTIPKWKKREPTPGFSQGLELTTPLDRKTFARLRSAKPAMLCMADIRDMGVCYVWDQRNSRAELMLRR